MGVPNSQRGKGVGRSLLDQKVLSSDCVLPITVPLGPFFMVYSDSLKLYDFMYNDGTYLKNGLFLERKKKVFERYDKLISAAVV